MRLKSVLADALEPAEHKAVAPNLQRLEFVRCTLRKIRVESVLPICREEAPNAWTYLENFSVGRR